MRHFPPFKVKGRDSVRHSPPFKVKGRDSVRHSPPFKGRGRGWVCNFIHLYQVIFLSLLFTFHSSRRYHEVDDLLLHADAILAYGRLHQFAVDTHHRLLGFLDHQFTGAVRMHAVVIEKTP